MEHFLRHDQGTVEKIGRVSRNLSLAVLLGCALCLSPATAGSDNQPANPASSTSLDFANGLYARKMYAPAIAEYEKFLRANPSSPEASSARFRYADSYYFTKDYASAIAHFELFLKEFPNDKRVPMAQFRLGTARYYRGDASRAIHIFRGLSQQSQDPVVRSGSIFYLAKCLENKGETDRALSILKNLTVTAPQSEYASYAGVAIGDIYLKGGNQAEAIAGYRIAADNGNPPEVARQASFKVAEILFSQKDYKEAAKYYQKVFETSPEESKTQDAQKKKESLKAKALVGLFYCDLNRQDLESAEKRFTANQPTIAASAYRGEILYLMANLLADAEKNDEAVKKLDEVLADPETDAKLKDKAQLKKISVEAASMVNAGRYRDALASFQKIVTDYPGSDNARNAEFQMGGVYLKVGQLEQARNQYLSFANKFASDPSAELALLQVIQIDLDAKNFRQAFESCDDFIKIHPKSQFLDIAYYKLGVAATGLGRHSHAAFVFLKIVDEFPSSKLHTEAVYGAAISLENDKKVKEALPLYERLLSEAPDHALSQEVWPRLGYLYIQVGEIEKVKALYQELIFNRPAIKMDTDGIFWLVQYFLDHGDYPSLDRLLEALPARFPEKDLKHEILFFKGESAMGAKDYPKAVSFYSQAIDAKPAGPFVPQARLGLGIAHAAMGDPLAEQDFNQALQYDHEPKIAMRARFELANLLLKAKDLEGAAKAFMLVAILYDDPKYTPPALYKAGECFRSIQRPDESQKAFEELKTRYPDSDWARRAP